MIKAGHGYAWRSQRGLRYTDFELCKLIFGFIPPLFQTYHKESGYISFTIENSILAECGILELTKKLNDMFNEFLKDKSEYDKITKILS